jgi:hypothetical protein
MTNEITANLRIQLSNAGLTDDFNPGKIQITQTGQIIFSRVVSIATTETSVALTGITTPGVCYLRNLDATNYVEAGTTTTDYPIKLRQYGVSGIPNILTLNASKTTLYLKANTAACKVLITVYEA